MSSLAEPLPLGFISNMDAQLVIAALALIGGVALLPYGMLERENMPFWNYVPAFVIPYTLANFWLGWVNKTVPEPYLDEFFHIPQAQRYCEGKYGEWDDKITTPPGLYLASVPWVSTNLQGMDCSTENLRSINVIVTALIALIAGSCRAHAEGSNLGKSGLSIQTGINIALFPVLFFFSGLYYTDVLSTGVVLLAYMNHISRVSRASAGSPVSPFNDVYTILLGILALFMRQTNIFWVVVYMGGLEAVNAVKALKPQHVPTPEFNSTAEQIQFQARRYSLGEIHDLPLNRAWPDDLLLCVVSIALGALYTPASVLRRVYPHIIVMVCFVGFVAWNGGVVLGDKSNHVATLHLAQMLYIWPLFAFFSAPLLIPQVFRLLPTAWKIIVGPSSATLSTKNGSTASTQGTRWNIFRRLCSVLIVVIATFVALMIVKFNTIIHPFTLADNRHYMFYIFRYTIRRGSMIRYALAPIYVTSSWLCWSTLYGPSVPPNSKEGGWVKDKDPEVSPGKQKSMAELGSTNAPPASTVVILLLATTLSLMTAPLVEPRYFILPWVFWRLLVPSSPGIPGLSLFKRVDMRLVLEMAWFLLINMATMYIFVTKPFHWKAEDGTMLDDGKVQHFMW